MNIAVIQIITGMLVRLLIKSAAPFAKVAETRIPVRIMRTATYFSIRFPKYFETIFGMSAGSTSMTSGFAVLA